MKVKSVRAVWGGVVLRALLRFSLGLAVSISVSKALGLR